MNPTSSTGHDIMITYQFRLSENAKAFQQPNSVIGLLAQNYKIVCSKPKVSFDCLGVEHLLKDARLCIVMQKSIANVRVHLIQVLCFGRKYFFSYFFWKQIQPPAHKHTRDEIRKIAFSKIRHGLVCIIPFNFVVRQAAAGKLNFNVFKDFICTFSQKHSSNEI